MNINNLKKKHIDVLINLNELIAFKGKSKSIFDSLISELIKSNEQKINSSQKNIDRNEKYDTRKIIELITDILNKSESIS